MEIVDNVIQIENNLNNDLNTSVGCDNNDSDDNDNDYGDINCEMGDDNNENHLEIDEIPNAIEFKIAPFLSSSKKGIFLSTSAEGAIFPHLYNNPPLVKIADWSSIA